MDTQQLRYFIAIVDNGSYLRAASALGATQSALTKSVARLESLLGVKLLNRGRHGATPTAFGVAFVSRARAICAEEVAARTELSDLMHGDHGHVRLGMGISFANGIVPVAIQKFREHYRRATITAIEGMSPELFKDLGNGVVDFVVSSPLDRPPSLALNFHQTFLFDDTDDIVAAQDHPLAGKPNVPFGALRDYPWVISERVPMIRHLVWQTFREHGVPPPDHVILTDSVELAKRLVTEQNYLVLLGREFIRYEEASGVLCALSIDGFRPMRSAYLTRRKGSTLNAASTKFIELLIEIAGRRMP